MDLITSTSSKTPPRFVGAIKTESPASFLDHLLRACCPFRDGEDVPLLAVITLFGSRRERAALAERILPEGDMQRIPRSTAASSSKARYAEGWLAGTLAITVIAFNIEIHPVNPAPAPRLAS